MSVRKFSYVSKTDYQINHHELPRVHRSPSSSSSVNSFKTRMLPKPVMPNINSSNFDNYSPKSSGSFNNNIQDKLETSSTNSYNSNLLDIPNSNLSISDSDVTNDFDTSVNAYENTIKELKDRLQECCKERDGYKLALKDFKWRTELAWQQKFQELLREKANYEGQLQTTKSILDEKEKLLTNLKENSGKSNFQLDVEKLQIKVNNLERLNFELNSKLTLANNEAKQWQKESTKLESENEQLRVSLQEMKLDIDSKNSSLLGLKNKITEQHIELQNYVQAKLKLSNYIATLNNEIESVKKSEKWYIEQLHACQLAKSKIQQELMAANTEIVTLKQNVETLRNESTYWRNNFEELQKKAVRDKEKLLRKMEILESDFTEREAILKCSQNKLSASKTKEKPIIEDNSSIKEEYEDKICTLEKLIEEKSSTVEDLMKQNSDYLVRVTTLQKTLNEKEIHYQALQNVNHDLEMKYSANTENLRTKDNQLLELRNKIVNLEVSLHAVNKEKVEIDEVVKNVRDDFSKFMKCYNNMKEKLEEKTKIIAKFECEKQESFMENNWRVCEIEELQRKILENRNLEADLAGLKSKLSEIMLENEQIKTNNQIQNTELQAKEENIKKLELDICNLETEILKLQECRRQEELIKSSNDTEVLNFESIGVQTELFFETIEENLSNIKTKISKYFTCDENYSSYDLINVIKFIDDSFDKILVKLDSSDKTNIDMRNKFLKIKNKFKYKIGELNEKCKRINNKYLILESKYKQLNKNECASIEIQTDNEECVEDISSHEIESLRSILYVKETEHEEKHKQFESYLQMLIRKVKDQMKRRKIVEKKLASLEETYNLALNEISNLKLISNRNEIELNTLRTQCEEYKVVCERQNQAILELEKFKGENGSSKNNNECLKCLESQKLKQLYSELDYQCKNMKDKILWYEKDINDKNLGITECKKQLFNEKLQNSSLKKQLSSLQMCLTNANEQLDFKQIEIAQLKTVCEKVEANKKDLIDQLESEQILHQETKRKFEVSQRVLEEKSANNDILADEIKSLSCHLHQKNLRLSSLESKLSGLESQVEAKENNFQKTISDLKTQLDELEKELEYVRNDKFFLQRLCNDLKMTLQGTINKNKVLQIRLESLENESTTRSLPNLSIQLKIDEDHINNLLQQSTILPDKPLQNLRSCLDSLKQEMAILQKEIISQTQTDV